MPAPRQTQDVGVADWKTITAIALGLAGSAAWIAAVGSAVVWLRMRSIDVAPAPTVAVLPTELRVAIGARYLVPPVLIAFGAFVLLYLLRSLGSQKQSTNERGVLPWAYDGVVAILAIVGVGWVVLGETSGWAVLLTVVIAALFVLATRQLVKGATGFGPAGVIVFITVLVASAALALVYEVFRNARMDLAAVVRTDRSAIGGFYVAQADDAVYLVTSGTPSGNARNEVYPFASNLTVPARRCDDVRDRLGAIADGSRRCYVNELVSVPRDQVAKLLIGPRGVEVGREGYEASRQLAQVALRRGDEERLAPKRRVKAPQKQGTKARRR